jgi:hypothetical protein
LKSLKKTQRYRGLILKRMFILESQVICLMEGNS